MSSAIKIISGGQTGVDRAALEWALGHNIDHGGWCPRGRKAEDGMIPLHFELTETDADDYAVRTCCNVRDSGGTVVFSGNLEVSGGTKRTLQFAAELRKPVLHLVGTADARGAAAELSAFLSRYRIRVLNVAGPRESEQPGLGSFVQEVLSLAMLPAENS